MTEYSCETVQPLLPEWVGGQLDDDAAEAVRIHVVGCTECSRETEVVRALGAARPTVDPDLAGRIQAALRDQVGAGGAPSAEGGGAPSRWSSRQPCELAAAAVVVLALGTAVIWPQVRGRNLPPTPDVVADEPLFADVFSADGGIVAGAPVIEEMTDEQLLTLLAELEG